MQKLKKKYLYAGDIDRDEVLGDLLPFDSPTASSGDMKNLCPQSEKMSISLAKASTT